MIKNLPANAGDVRMSYSWNYMVGSLSVYLLSLSKMHFIYFHLFSWFDGSFFFTSELHCLDVSVDPFTY